MFKKIIEFKPLEYKIQFIIHEKLYNTYTTENC